MAKEPKSEPASATQWRADGWRNLYTALGDLSRDKRKGMSHATNVIDELTAEDLWRGSDLAARIVEKPVSVQLRGGFTVQITDTEPAEPPEPLDSEDRRTDKASTFAKSKAAPAVIPSKKPFPSENSSEDPNALDPVEESTRRAKEAKAKEDKSQEWAKAVDAKARKLRVLMHLRKALHYRRAFGGAAILVGANDKEDPSKPLDLTKLKSVEWFTVLRPRELRPASYYRDPMHEKFGEPRVYTLQRETSGAATAPQVKVHATRIFRLDGVIVSNRQRAENNGWGDNVFTRIMPVLADFEGAWGSSAALMQDFAQAVFKIKGLAELLLQKDGDKTMLARARAIDLSRSVARAMLIDESEEFERKTTPVTGLPDLLDRWCNRFAAAADMPVTILMGQAPAGLNATGASDLRTWYDSLESDRDENVVPMLEWMLRLLMLSSEGPTQGTEPAEWAAAFDALGQLDEAQEAERRLKVAQADKVYIDATVLTPEEVAISRWGRGKYNPETTLDMEARSVEPPKGPNTPPELNPFDPNADPNAPPKPGGGKPPPFAKKKPAGA